MALLQRNELYILISAFLFILNSDVDGALRKLNYISTCVLFKFIPNSKLSIDSEN